MNKFIRHAGKVVPLNRANVDTDAIMPKQYLKCISKVGYGDWLFDDWRYLEPGDVETPVTNRKLNPKFELNLPQFQDASIVLAQANFGCGSSREHAVWGLRDYGIRVIIAPSFPDIFFQNCSNNGLLAITLPQRTIDKLFELAGKQTAPEMSVDLNRQYIEFADVQLSFDIDAGLREKLLEGLDSIAATLKYKDAIHEFEQNYFKHQPWLLNALSTNK